MNTKVTSNAAASSEATDGASFSSREWLDYFQRNESDLIAVPWDNGAELTSGEKKLIYKSIRIFQLGESSEGRHLSKCAQKYAERNNDPDYYSAIRLFIREEQRHARELGRFMELNRISTIRKTFSDSVFRMLRKPAGLELSVAVLVTAEIVAQIYYPALKAATKSQILRTICDQIIRDEDPHVQFQCERLAIVRTDRSVIRRSLSVAAHKFLMFGTLFVVWAQHRSVFRAAGVSFTKFWSQLWAAWRQAVRVMNSR